LSFGAVRLTRGSLLAQPVFYILRRQFRSRGLYDQTGRMEVRHQAKSPKMRAKSRKAAQPVYVSPEKACAELTSAVHAVYRQRNHASRETNSRMITTVQNIMAHNVIKNHECLSQQDWDSIMALQKGVRRLNNEIKQCDAELREVIAKAHQAKRPADREALRDRGNQQTIELMSLQSLAADLKVPFLSRQSGDLSDS
jgi:hypothetical protein